MKISEAREKLEGSNIRIQTSQEASDSVPGTILRQELLDPQTKIDPQKTNTIRFVIAAYPTFRSTGRSKAWTSFEAQSLLESQGGEVMFRAGYQRHERGRSCESATGRRDQLLAGVRHVI